MSPIHQGDVGHNLNLSKTLESNVFAIKGGIV